MLNESTRLITDPLANDTFKEIFEGKKLKELNQFFETLISNKETHLPDDLFRNYFEQTRQLPD